MLMKLQNWALERGFGLWDLCNRGWDHGSTPGNASHEAMLSSAHTAGTLTCSEHPTQGDSCGLSPDKCCIKRDQFDSADPLQPLMQGLLGLTGAAVRARRCLLSGSPGSSTSNTLVHFPRQRTQLLTSVGASLTQRLLGCFYSFVLLAAPVGVHGQGRGTGTGTGTVSMGLPSQNLAGPTRQADPECWARQAVCRQGLVNPNLPQSEGYK